MQNRHYQHTMSSLSDTKWTEMFYTSCSVTACDKKNNLVDFFTVYYLED